MTRALGIQDYIDDGYAEKASESTTTAGMTWYIPHHAVFSPKKPDKLRIVFDCSAKFRGTSLNDQIHQGPDFTNKLIGVLLRFREKPVAIVADVQAMYHQVRVTPAHRDALRFLWPEGDKIESYRMCVHLFGGIWSASVACYALKRAAEDNVEEFEPEIIDAVLHNFYVDDLLQSVDTDAEAIDMAEKIRQLLATRGFNLTKWLSNSRDVLLSIPIEHRAKDVQKIDLERDELPKERALGVSWLVEDDVFMISVYDKRPLITKRGLCSMYSSVYDPLGFVAIS